MKKLVNIIPAKYRCNFDASCPAVFKTNQGTYYIVGNTLNADTEGLKGKVGSHETAVEISAELFEATIANVIKGAIKQMESGDSIIAS